MCVVEPTERPHASLIPTPQVSLLPEENPPRGFAVLRVQVSEAMRFIWERPPAAVDSTGVDTVSQAFTGLSAWYWVERETTPEMGESRRDDADSARLFLLVTTDVDGYCASLPNTSDETKQPGRRGGSQASNALSVANRLATHIAHGTRIRTSSALPSTSCSCTSALSANSPSSCSPRLSASGCRCNALELRGIHTNRPSSPASVG